MRRKPEGSGKSPYTKYGKKPYKYSELHAQWRRARMEGKEDTARRLGMEHTTRWLKESYYGPTEADHS